MAMKNWVLIGAVLLLAACQPRPVLNIVGEPVVTGSQKEPTLEAVQGVIRTSIMKKTWIVDKVEPGKIDAHLVKSDDTARISITFTTKQYDIRYVSSDGLQYDGTKIFYRYNSWIKGLQETINKSMKSL